MFIVMGGTGNVGGAVTSALLAQGEPVAIVTRRRAKAAHWIELGARVLEADVLEPTSLRAAFRQGKRAFVLNPPADPTHDTDALERRTVRCILEALEDCGLEKVVAASTAGAQAGDRIGDLSVLWELEQGLHDQPIPAAIQRGAYYMSNWDAQLATARESGRLQSMIPAQMSVPMVSPADLGQLAAQPLRSPLHDIGVRHVEGPRRYSPNMVAQVFSELLGRTVEVTVTPREQLRQGFEALGFCEAAAHSYARMTALSIDRHLELPHEALRGPTTLEEHLRRAAESLP